METAPAVPVGCTIESGRESRTEFPAYLRNSRAEEVAMCCASQVNCSGLRSSIAALVLVGVVRLLMAAENGAPGPLAQTCGVPAGTPAGGGRGLPQFPPGQYPVKLPPVSMLGA